MVNKLTSLYVQAPLPAGSPGFMPQPLRSLEADSTASHPPKAEGSLSGAVSTWPVER